LSQADQDQVRNWRAIARLASFAPLSAEEIGLLAGMGGSARNLRRGDLIRGEEDDPTHLHLLIEGWAASRITLANGSRHLTMVSLPGDMLGLPALAVREPIDAVMALSKAVVLDIPIAGFSRLFVESPRLATLVFLVSQEERVFAMERLALLGQAKARTRLAALLLRIAERIGQLERAQCDRFALPLTQQDLGELIGVSAVHINALLKDLRNSGIATITSRELCIHDREALASLAGVSRWRRARPAWLP
jgi:CRP/FNR family transcriptional regulator, anaerobic regulatory protein